MFALSDILLFAVVSAILVAAGLHAMMWAKKRYRYLTAAVATFVGFASWNVLQSSTGADAALNIDWPILPLSWSDVGSGVAAFAVTAVTLGVLTDRKETAGNVMTASVVAGLLATLVDLFVL